MTASGGTIGLLLAVLLDEPGDVNTGQLGAAPVRCPEARRASQRGPLDTSCLATGPPGIQPDPAMSWTAHRYQQKEAAHDPSCTSGPFAGRQVTYALPSSASGADRVRGGRMPSRPLAVPHVRASDHEEVAMPDSYRLAWPPGPRIDEC